MGHPSPLHLLSSCRQILPFFLELCIFTIIAMGKYDNIICAYSKEIHIPMTPSFLIDKDTIHYSSERQDDILTAMGIPWLDPSSCDPMFSMLHPASSTTPSVGLIPPSHSSTRTSSNSSSSVSTPRHVQQSDMFWQAPANGTLPIYAASVSPPNSQQMVHRRSMPEIKQPYQNNTSTSTRRQRRRTEGTVTVDDGDDEQRRQMFLERNRQGKEKVGSCAVPVSLICILSFSCIQMSITQETMAHQLTKPSGIHGYRQSTAGTSDSQTTRRNPESQDINCSTQRLHYCKRACKVDGLSIILFFYPSTTNFQSSPINSLSKKHTHTVIVYTSRLLQFK